MIPLLACGRRIISKGPVWRCLQEIRRTPNYSKKAQQQVYARISPAPVSWLASGLGHRCVHSTSEEQGSRHSKESFSLKALTQAPKPALLVGLSGLIPFLSAPLLMAATQTFYPEVAFAHMVYGACMVSFFGGARWGFAIPDGSPAPPDWMNLGNSVVPSLVAWLALLCRDNVAEGALVVIMGLGLSLHYDLNLLPGYPAWFKAMRTVITLVATFSLVATLMLKKFCPEKKIKEHLN
ncbi:transmembrane protein 69-like [Genypterus blacodes]|uniref:transmembrane protein 69-like n=1 Tax=Genypterus blacodes TaxID=154954 RepID=UPI003F766150